MVTHLLNYASIYYQTQSLFPICGTSVVNTGRISVIPEIVLDGVDAFQIYVNQKEQQSYRVRSILTNS